MVAAPDMTGMDRVADDVARSLVQVRPGPGADARIVTPVMFPAGGAVVVRIGGGPTSFLVTDDGGAAREADDMGAGDLFARLAPGIATRAGVRFNRHELFEIDAPLGRLPGFVRIVADASRAAAEATALALAERLSRIDRTRVYDVAREVFGAGRVTRRPAISGASNTSWKFDAGIDIGGGRLALLRSVSPAAGSVFAGYARFDDVARLEEGHRLAAVVSSISSFETTQVVMLRRTAEVIEFNSAADRIREIAA